MWQELAGRRLLRNTGVAMETTSSGASRIRAWSHPPAGEYGGVEHCLVSARITCSSGGRQAAPGDTS